MTLGPSYDKIWFLAYPEEEQTEVDDEGQDEGQVLYVVEITGKETLHGKRDTQDKNFKMKALQNGTCVGFTRMVYWKQKFM